MIPDHTPIDLPVDQFDAAKLDPEYITRLKIESAELIAQSREIVRVSRLLHDQLRQERAVPWS